MIQPYPTQSDRVLKAGQAAINSRHKPDVTNRWLMATMSNRRVIMGNQLIIRYNQWVIDGLSKLKILWLIAQSIDY